MQPRPPAARTAAFGLPRGRQAAASAGLLDDSVLTGTPLACPWVVAFPLFGEPTGRTAIAAKSEISKDKSGKFRFHLKAANGEIIAAQPRGTRPRKVPTRALSRSKRTLPTRRS